MLSKDNDGSLKMMLI